MLKYLQNQQVSGVFFQQVKEELKVEAWPRLALPAAGLAFDDALDLVDLMERPASLVSSCTGGAWHHGCTTIEKGFKLTRHGEKMIGPLHTALEIPKTFHINEIEWQFNRNSMMSILLWESLDVVLLTLLKLANMNNMELDIAPWSPSAMLWLLQYDTAQHEWAWQWWLINIGEKLIWTRL